VSRVVRPARDSDARAIRRASRVVGMWIAITCTAIVVIGIVAIFLFILSEISPSERLEPLPANDIVRVGALKLLRGAIVLGIALIALAGVMSWLVTRRAVQPLGAALRIQRDFVADASHELRTPLTVLDARLQILQRQLPDGDPSSVAVAELRRDAKSLIDIVNDLLDSAAIGANSITANTAVAVTPAVAEAVRALTIVATQKNIALELTASDPAFSFVPAVSITRCTIALIDNALRYAPPHSVVSVAVEVKKRAVTVSVRDSGPGIHGIDPARIFDRFAHSGSRSDGSGIASSGSGIGLSLVRETAVQYGGTVLVIDSSASGTAIAFTVPLVNPR